MRGILSNYTLIFLLLCCTLWSCHYSNTLSKQEKEYLKGYEDIYVGVYVNYPPYQFVNDSGKIDGILLDYFSLIEEKIDHQFKKKVYTNWQLLLNDVKLGVIDIVLEIQQTEKRSKYLSFTKPIFTGRHMVACRSNDNYTTIQSLKGKKVALGADYSIEEYALENFPDIEIVPKANESECLDALIHKEVDAVISVEAVLNYLITKKDISDIKVEFALNYENDLGIAVHSPRETLFKIINKANDEISDEEKKAILEKWLYDIHEPFYKKNTSLFKYTVLALLLLSLGFNIYQQKKIRNLVNKM
ncbi:transporter substrate-binding domain-containing protein [Tenacibaculum agarivorans]|uniref:transporter substrate-binding domain-containing protein n=1 Tax=Tenacibaculum agarivorans TaxID=1908389 RepID=UPI0009F9A1B5|nr:transporter substrate-binding domain-containing protein [Tenacibaculum agarivorans]